ncbi:helix-turn-helix transcriptional regulator [Streptomyces griseiscabiei]|uniref:Helix-turn-helix transcriptional regulator n=1 Tax=Streptomyces griseiscabiei TaxID=2993540 RepID=A0ABU4L7U9_9ACTN|nr:helix-turn-helix transcriptional regulator [Streptomyces griseiscabiei]MBZ3906832.1 helix-turn-helix transcriptional regulator [Streptomyces griseiscabiei]MDX2911789.1 helix-turn-helix transcriptional regulator [Streptomyces griseiscabiei]
MTAEPHGHAADELCEAGAALYARALREGGVAAEETAAAPCLIDIGLLHPAIGTPHRLEPAAPVTALHRLLRGIEDRVAEERRREERLTAAFEPLLRLADTHTAVSDTGTPAVTLLSGVGQINAAITEAMAEATREMFCIQPHTHQHGRRGQDGQAGSLGRDQAMLSRGCRIRALYPHTLRHSPLIATRYEQLRGDAEARTLDQVTDRLILLDRTVAFIPADTERTLALEVRHPTLISFFATTFDRFWHLATPMYPDAVQLPVIDGVTPRQRAIATLLVEGHTDAVIADRLGLNIRTARVHIAKLASLLGSESRAQLGYLIGRSGILERGPGA